jgi:putative transposase
MISRIQELLQNIPISKSESTYNKILDRLLPLLVQEFNKHYTKKVDGRPRKVDISKVFQAIFFVARSGAQYSYVQTAFGLAKSTFCYYLKIISKYEIIEKFLGDFLSEVEYSHLYITDTFTVKSMDGYEGLGRNPTDRGRNGNKVSLIIDENHIPIDISIEPANKHDATILKSRLNTVVFNTTDRVQLLADSGYVGKPLQELASSKNIQLTAKPRKKRNQMPTHVLTDEDSELLKKKRGGIELVNGQTRRHRGIHVKYVKKRATYKTMVFLVVLCIFCFNYFLKPRRHA